MDYFEGVVTDYLRADHMMFVKPEFLIQLDSGETPPGGAAAGGASTRWMFDRNSSNCSMAGSGMPDLHGSSAHSIQQAYAFNLR